MHSKHINALAALIGATMLLAATAATASAGRLSSTSQTLRATWSEMTFRLEGTTVTCPVTLEGSLHSRTIAKVAESLVGYVTRAVLGERCSIATARALAETLPWHLRYESFAGALPNISGINARIVLMAFQLRATILGSVVTCLYRTSASSPATVRFTRNTASGTIISVTAGGTIDEPSRCPSAVLGGTSTSVTQLGTTTVITVTLI
jgi:hypothetical protein